MCSLIRLVLLVSFCCSPLLSSVLLSFRLTLVLRSVPLFCCVCAVLLLLVCSVLLCLCCPVVLVSSCLFFAPRTRCLCWFCAPRCACAGLGVSRVACPPLLCFLPLLFFLPCPACSLFCALVQLTLLCAGASLGVSGCSCDGSVALLSCWVYGLALFSLRHSVHGNKGFLPCVGFFPSTPCYW